MITYFNKHQGVLVIVFTALFACENNRQIDLSRLGINEDVTYLIMIPAHSCSGCKDKCLKFASNCSNIHTVNIKFVLTGFDGDYREIIYIKEDYNITNLYYDSLDYLTGFTKNILYPSIIRVVENEIVQNISLDATNTEAVLNELKLYCK